MENPTASAWLLTRFPPASTLRGGTAGRNGAGWAVGSPSTRGWKSHRASSVSLDFLSPPFCCFFFTSPPWSLVHLCGTCPCCCPHGNVPFILPAALGSVCARFSFQDRFRGNSKPQIMLNPEGRRWLLCPGPASQMPGVSPQSIAGRQGHPRQHKGMENCSEARTRLQR